MSRRQAIIGHELEQIALAKGGRFTSGDVVDAARPTSAPLHPEFEWDDSVAGEAYRREQARKLIRYVDITFHPPTGDPITVRKFHSITDPTSDEPVFAMVDAIFADPPEAAELIETVERDWERATHKRDDLVALQGLLTGTTNDPPMVLVEHKTLVIVLNLVEQTVDDYSHNEAEALNALYRAAHGRPGPFTP